MFGIRNKAPFCTQSFFNKRGVQRTEGVNVLLRKGNRGDGY